jgi:outer membrane protein OmpA-like peptidoglycan-associated protein
MGTCFFALPPLALSPVGRWDEKAPIANFLMLNPSTADEAQLDPSCTRARTYAERWGFGSLPITNIFAWRATDPQEMKAARDPVGRGNDAAILRAAREAAVVVCAWGNAGYENVALDAIVLFDFDRWTLRPASRQALEDFVLRMHGLESQTVRVIGYADRIGSEASNQILAEERASAVIAR